MIGNKHRFASIDFLRGLSVMVMFLVSKTSPVRQLRHGAWFECTVADLVYPAFLCISGVSMAISVTRCSARGMTGSEVVGRLARRLIVIFAIGILLSSISARVPQLSMGTLQSIAVASLTAVPAVLLGWRARLIYFALFLCFGTALLKVGSFEDPMKVWIAEGNVAAELDLLVMGNYRGVEGILGSVFSGAFVVIGLVVGAWLQESGWRRWLVRVMELSVALITLGVLLSSASAESPLFVPVVTRLASASFVLHAASILIAATGAIVFLIEGLRLPVLFSTIRQVGENPLAIFAGVKLFDDLVLRVSFGDPGVTVKGYLRELATTGFGPTMALLTIPAVKIAVALLLAAYLSRNHLKLRV